MTIYDALTSAATGVGVDGANDIKLFDISNLGIAYRAQDLVKDLATTTLEEKDLSKIIPIINKHYSMELPTPISP